MPNHFSRSPMCGYVLGGFFIGVSLAGFFDGIFLHQILQWHSLLSSLDGQLYQDLRFRMLADGLFHAAMYCVALLGLWLLWRGRHAFASERSGKYFASTFLIGFGVWHLTDAVLNHWLLGLHHIKDDSAHRLSWDLAFFALGLICVVLGILLCRSGRIGKGRVNNTAALSVGIIVLAAGAVAALPWSHSGAVTVVFQHGIGQAAVLASVERARGRILWNSPEGDVWTIAVENGFDGLTFYGHGALFVSGSVFGNGCFSASASPST
jgi:uncharacterized membrane protein